MKIAKKEISSYRWNQDYVTYLNRNKEIINNKLIYFETNKMAFVEIAIQVNTGYSENIYCI